MASAAITSSNTSEASQYHHYIPRFILKTFARPLDPAEIPKGVKKRRGKDGLYSGPSVLHSINLDGPAPWIRETSVARTFGLVDMYRDFEAAANQHDLERRLSTLESCAGHIIAEIRKCYEEGKQEIWLTRARKDILRKFLFVMKYRSSGFHRRYRHLKVDDYTENDKDRLKAYMLDKGYSRPIDVWFDNMKALLVIQIDAEDKWIKFLTENMYPDDAMWAISNIRMFYMAICTPSRAQDEFLLTQNAYSIFEGPDSTVTDPRTGETRGAYTEFHTFTVISPKLVLVLRSFLLPDSTEDCIESISKWRKEWFAESAAQHIYPSRVKSALEDLPVCKPRNSYTKAIDGKNVFLDGEDGTHKASHKFCFRLFPISTSHVNKINFVMLEQCHSISTVVFKTKASLSRVLEAYLTAGIANNDLIFSKKAEDSPFNEPRKACLVKLEQVAKELGVNVTAKCAIGHDGKPLSKGKSVDRMKMKELESAMIEALPKVPSDTTVRYNKLGGSPDTIFGDLDQAKKMLNMRIKIDVWSKGLDERLRQQIRENLGAMFRQLLPRRMWYYLKEVRHLELGRSLHKMPFDSLPRSDSVISGPEDVIAESSYLFRRTDLSRIMYFAVMNQMYIAKRPHLNRLSRTQHLLHSAGTICDCGIPLLEAKAKSLVMAMHVAGFPASLKNPEWTEMENIEMAVRMQLRRNLAQIVESTLVKGRDLKDLEKVLFEILYLTVM